jgi:hypothetical protein
LFFVKFVNNRINMFFGLIASVCQPFHICLEIFEFNPIISNRIFKVFAFFVPLKF